MSREGAPGLFREIFGQTPETTSRICLPRNTNSNTLNTKKFVCVFPSQIIRVRFRLYWPRSGGPFSLFFFVILSHLGLSPMCPFSESPGGFRDPINLSNTPHHRFCVEIRKLVSKQLAFLEYYLAGPHRYLALRQLTLVSRIAVPLPLPAEFNVGPSACTSLLRTVHEHRNGGGAGGERNDLDACERNDLIDFASLRVFPKQIPSNSG